ncbi:MAG: hypothetical protein Kow00117_23460 [Phototrophicales bacterium]
MERREFAFYCPRCQFGRCYVHKGTYTRVYHGHLLSMPDIQLYVCDVCGYQEFDYQTMHYLHLLLDDDEILQV